MKIAVTEDMRSMIASAYVAGLDQKNHGLCCSADSLHACAAIVGRKYAESLQTYAYEKLQCSVGDIDEQYFLDKISSLTELRFIPDHLEDIP